MSAGPEIGPGTVPFGFRRVAAAEKQHLVRDVFDSVAPRYDLMNDLMSAGVHRLWKASLVVQVAPRPAERFLDVAGGTGDVAFRLLNAAGGAATGAHVAVCDINASMLSVGRDRALDRGLLQGLAWVAGDAERLPVASGSVDAYTIAFGLRNVTRIDKALTEARRVLKPGGRFFCLEFSRVVAPLLGKIYDAYSFSLLPVLGEIVAGDRPAYQYLVESIRRFPPQDELLRLMAEAGLERGRVRNLSGGIAAIHSAWRI